MKLSFHILGDSERETIHRTALTVLERVGLRIKGRALFDRLRRAGAPADAATQVVHLPPTLVAETLASAPRGWTWMGQAGGGLALPSQRSYFVARVLLSQVLDYGQPAVRPPRLQDIANLCRLADALPGADIVYKVDCPCSDVPAELAYLETIAAVYRNTVKPCLANPIHPLATRYWVELAEAATGRPIDQQPSVLCGMPATSPLTVDVDTGESLLYLTGKRAPINCMTMPIAGISAPITLAGALAQHTAEVLGLIAIVQMLNPGNPVSYAGMACTANMRTGTISMAAALPLFAAALTEMAHHFGLPALCAATYTDTFTPGVQCGAEKALAALAGIAAGSAVGTFGGDLSDAMTISYEQLLLDYAIWETAARFARGVTVTPETLGLEAIERVGHAGEFLTDAHTVHWLRGAEQSSDFIFNRDGAGPGVQTALERAHARVQQILAQGPASPVGPAALARIEAYVQEETARIRRHATTLG